MSCFSTETEICKHCKLSDFQEGYGPRTLLICDGCESVGSHVECEERDTAKKISEEMLSAGHNWYCSKGCEGVATELLTWSGRRIPLDYSYTLEFASKYDQQTKGTSGTVDTAKRLLKQSFNPLIMDNGRDLVDMLCSSYESPQDADEDEHFNFSNFRVVVLRKGAMCVSAATLRVFGTAFAELPFVATRDGYRRDGNLTRLMHAVESQLATLGVQYMIVPSMRQLLGMWRDKFGFVPLTLAEAEALDDRIVSPDSDSAQLLKKALGPRTMTPPQPTTRALRSGRCRESGTPQQKSEQRPAKTDTSSPSCCNEVTGISPGPAGPAALSGLTVRSHLCGSPAVQQVNAVRLRQQTMSVAAGPHGQNEGRPVGGVSMSVPVSAQPAAQPLQIPRTSTAAQPTADGSAGKESASTSIEGPFPVPELGPGWTRTCRIYLDSKRRHTIYRSPQGSTFRSMLQAAAHAKSIATEPASSVVAANEAAEPSTAAAMSKVAANLASRVDPSASKHPGTRVATRPSGQGVVKGLPVMPPATASVRPLMKAPLQIGARPPAVAHLPPGQLVRPPSTANTMTGLMLPPPPKVPRTLQPQAPARPLLTKAANLSPPWHHLQQDAIIAQAIAQSVRQYVNDLHEETLVKNETLASENTRLRQEIEELKCFARQTPSHSSAADQAESKTEAQSDKDAQVTPSPEAPGQEVQAMGIPLAAAAMEAAAADALAEAPDGSAGAHAAAQSAQPRLPNSIIGAHSDELPSTPESGRSTSASAPMLQALPDAPASLPSESSTLQLQYDTAHRDHSSVHDAAAALEKASDETLCTGAPTVIMEQSAVVLAKLGPRDSVDVSPLSADCGKGTHAAAEEGQELAQEMDWEAPRKPDPVATARMQGNSDGYNMSAGEDSFGQMLASEPEANAASTEKFPRSQRPQVAEDHAAHAAADVHGSGGNPVQAAAEMQAKLGSVVELVSAICSGFSPHDAAGALLHNLQDVLSEVQQDAARIADQLSGALPARQCPIRLPDGCDCLGPRGDVNLPAQPRTKNTHASRRAQEQPVTSIPAAANLLYTSADPMAQPHEEGRAGEMCSDAADSGPEQGSAEPVSIRFPLLECDINSPGLRGPGTVQEQDPPKQQQQWHGHNVMATKCNAAQAAPAAALCGGGNVKTHLATEKTGFARHSWPGAVQRAVRSVFSLGTARLAPSRHNCSKSRQPAAGDPQTCVAVGMKKAPAEVESVAEGIEEAQKEGMQAGRGGKGGHSKALGAQVLPCTAQLQQSGEPASCPQGTIGQGLSGAGQCMGNAAEAADAVTEPEEDLTETATPAADGSEVEAAQVLVPITHSQADTMEAMQPAVATQLAMPTDSYPSQPGACVIAPCPPSLQLSQLRPDYETLAQGPIHAGQQPPCDSRAKGETESEAAPSAMAAAAAAATEAPRSDEPGASRKRANEAGGSAAWAWALAVIPSKRSKTSHTSDVISQQVEDSKHEDAVELNDCQSDTSVDAALQQTALFCDQLGSRDDD